jgi:hypothetical protein
MTDRTFKPDSGTELVFEDSGSTDRLRIIDGGSTILYDEGGSAALTVETDGDIALTQDIYLAAGKGIYFDGGTTSANYLGGSDAYEEGTWTGVLRQTASPYHEMTMSSDTGYYTKIGNLVTVSGWFQTSSLGSPAASGDIQMIGLPFTIANNAAAYTSGIVGYASGLAITAGHTVSYMGNINNTFFSLQVGDLTTGTSYMQASEWSADGGMIIGFTYRAA